MEDRDIEVEFLYFVKWKETTTSFNKRMDNYSVLFTATPLGDTLFLNKQWIRQILVYISRQIGMLMMRSQLMTKKRLGGSISMDVLRFPKNKSLFSTCLSSGTQLFAL